MCSARYDNSKVAGLPDPKERSNGRMCVTQPALATGKESGVHCSEGCNFRESNLEVLMRHLRHLNRGKSTEKDGRDISCCSDNLTRALFARTGEEHKQQSNASSRP